MARTWDIPCQVKRANVMAYAKAHGMGVEEAARLVRYQALDVMAQRARCAAIVTAHTADDQVETVMMHFLRGAGAVGLSGMPVARRLSPSSRMLLVRPFLRVRKEQLLTYLKTHALSYRRDLTNLSLKFSRNRIRLATLPYLEKLNPGLRERLMHTADIFRQEEDFWSGQVVREFRKTVRRNGPAFTVVLPRLLGYHKALSRRILRRVLPGSSFQDIEQVLQLARSPEEKGCLEFPGGWRVRRDKKKLVVFQKRAG
jgi:tRNA(Ile)-lysidine synthase